MMDCVFCKVASGDIPAKTFYRDENIVAISDINPQAPTHLLVMPTTHYDNVSTLAAVDGAVFAKLMDVAARLGTQYAPRGFRLVVNTGNDGGQTVDHVHVHILAGRQLVWPPG